VEAAGIETDAHFSASDERKRSCGDDSRRVAATVLHSKDAVCRDLALDDRLRRIVEALQAHPDLIAKVEAACLQPASRVSPTKVSSTKK
jgi:hypothetical protein